MSAAKCSRCKGFGCHDPAFLGVDECEVCGGSGVSPFTMDLGRRVRLLIIGHGQHGKDCTADVLAQQYGLRVISSSKFAARKAVFPLVSDLYVDWREAYEDRHAHRDLWYHAIAAYNLRPGPMLAEQILEQHDVYTGMRRRAELVHSRHLFDLVVWVDAMRRLPPEPSSSMELNATDADWIVDNNGPLEALPGEIAKLAKEISDRHTLADAFAQHA
ncbi:hypothetical protein [Tritonibacter mobilis]|nr:hypothetical protein [Tritonibacter mobilis]KJZ23279.1 hypothetical protein TW79_13380 [Tritonibacter mobilis]